MNMHLSERSEMAGSAAFPFFRFKRFSNSYITRRLFYGGLLHALLLASILGLLLPNLAEAQHAYEDWLSKWRFYIVPGVNEAGQNIYRVHLDWIFYVEPDVAEKGEQVRIVARSRPPPPPSEVFRGITIKIIHPDCVSSTVLGPYESINGSLHVYFTPTMNGIYKIVFHFPRQFFVNSTIICEGCTLERTLTVSPLPDPPPYQTVGKWEKMRDMPTSRGGLGVAVVSGKIYAIGGSTETTWPVSANPRVVDVNEEYDPVKDVWVSRKPMPTARAFFGIAVYQDRIYCIGGLSKEGPTGVVEVYDPSTNDWETRSPMPEEALKGRTYVEVSAAMLSDMIHVVVSEGAHYAYNPATDTWIKKAPLPVDEFNFNNAIVALDGRLYAVSGNSIFIYHPEKDSWRTAASLPMPLNHVVAAATSGCLTEKMICAFSSDIIPPVFGVWRAGYTYIHFPGNDSWIRAADMPTGRVYPGAAAYNDTIYVVGGFTPVISYLVKPSNVSERFQPTDGIETTQTTNFYIIAIATAIIITIPIAIVTLKKKMPKYN